MTHNNAKNPASLVQITNPIWTATAACDLLANLLLPHLVVCECVLAWS